MGTSCGYFMWIPYFVTSDPNHNIVIDFSCISILHLNSPPKKYHNNDDDNYDSTNHDNKRHNYNNDNSCLIFTLSF